MLAVLAVLVAGIWIATAQLNRPAYSPSGQVRAYLDALIDEDPDAMTELFETWYAPEDTVLLGDEIAATVDSGVLGYEIDDVTITGDTARVEVSLEREDGSERARYELERTGESFLLLDEWRMIPDPYRGVPLAGVELSWP